MSRNLTLDRTAIKIRTCFQLIPCKTQPLYLKRWFLTMVGGGASSFHEYLSC